MSRSTTLNKLKPLLLGLGLLLLCLLMFLGIRSVLQDKPKAPKPTVARIELLRPPPPPPPPPPKEMEKPPEPPKDEMKIDEPAPVEPTPTPQPEANDDQPPQESLGTNVEGEGGPDYGLAKGGGDGRTIGGGGGSKARWFAQQLQKQLQTALTNDARLKNLNYRVTVMFWLDERGAVERFELKESTGDAATDRALRAALADFRGAPTAPPEGMQEPVGLAINSRT